MANIALWKVLTGQPEILQPVDLRPAPASLDACSERLPGGAYTTLRTFNGDRFLHLQAHLDRLEETARLSGMQVTLDQAALREALRRVVGGLVGWGEKRLRITLDLEEEIGALYIAVEPLQVPAEELYQKGVAVVTCPLHRENPKAKLTEFIETANQVRQNLTSGIHEAILIDDHGQALEGLSSNFFAVKSGAIWTADEGVLSGITRSIVLEEAAREGVSVHLCGMAAEKLADMDEAFITSSSRAVLPVTRINDLPVASSKPGPITRLLLARYRKRIEAEIEPA